MIRKLKKIIHRWTADYGLDDRAMPISTKDSDYGGGFCSDGMRFQMYRASGGIVIETRRINHDHNHIVGSASSDSPNIYIITDQQDIGAELSKIITIESLKIRS